MKTLILALMFTAPAFAATPAPTPTDESRYSTLEAKELSLSLTTLNGQPIVGATTTEKSTGSVLCQKTGAVVPKPIYTFTCYTAIPDSLAEAHYGLVTGVETRVTFRDASGAVLLGTETVEKKMPGLICRKQRAITPNAKFSYKCFMNKGAHSPHMMSAF